MVNFKEMSEEEILERRDGYIRRLRALEVNISQYLHARDDVLGYRIKEEYKELKESISEEAKYLDKLRNDISHISKTHAAYQHGIIEASAWGFSTRTNGAIGQSMFSSVEEAEYKLNKYFTY